MTAPFLPLVPPTGPGGPGLRDGPERRRRRHGLGMAERPDDGEDLADQVVHGHLSTAGVAEVDARVRGVGPVVALDPDVALLDLHVEVDHRGPLAPREV